jgi:saccharopine dehydrogenase-like NADP-dependent oxidoreductase
VMQHQLEYELGGKRHRLISSMVDKGVDQWDTSISRTVGLPAAIAARLILQGKVQTYGVVLPIYREIFQPVLEELKKFGIHFTEQQFLVGEAVPA